MTGAAIRLRNLKYLLAEHKQDQVTFAKRLGINPNSLNHNLREKRNIGNRRARQIEAKLSLAKGWLDQPHPREWQMYGDTEPRRALTHSAINIASRLEALGDEELNAIIVAQIEMAERRKRALIDDETMVLPALSKRGQTQ